MADKQKESSSTFTSSSSLFQMWVILVSLALGIAFGIFAGHTIFWLNDSITPNGGVDLHQGWEKLYWSGVPEMLYVAQAVWCIWLILVLVWLSLLAHKNDIKKTKADDAKSDARLSSAIATAFREQGISQDIASKIANELRKHNNQQP